MAWNSNLSNWLSGSPRQRELDETRKQWEEAERAWRMSPLATEKRSDRAVAILQRVVDRSPRWPADPILNAMGAATEALLEDEDPGEIEPTWEVIQADAVVAVNFRKMLARRRRFASDYLRLNGIIGTQIELAFTAILDALPPACFGTWTEDSSAFEAPLIEVVDDPASLVQHLLFIPYTDDTLRLDLFANLRSQLVTNMLLASGLPPTADPQAVQHKMVGPLDQRGKSPGELASMYLAGTPFAKLLEIPVPIELPDSVRFEHAHILGGTGHGKTQLLQRMIHADLVAAKEDGRSVVVIDSQGDLINKISRLDLFDADQPGSLAHRLVLVDPGDIEYPASLNLFDPHLTRVGEYRLVDRERVLNGVVELYEAMFGDMLGAELTQKQGVVFRYLARLMITIPGATIHTLMQLMEDGKPFKPYMDKLEGSARYFFETEFFHPSFGATKKQILRRLWGVLSTPAFERMFAQRENKIDLFEATQAGKIILVSTAKDLLKRDGSALLGRFFITMLMQAGLERSVVAEYERTPTFVYVDEAHEYFDEGVETILQQARKYRIGLTLAHQSLDQASPRLRSALFSNTSLKCAGGVSAKDARALADELHTTPDFIESMKRRPPRSEFAAWVKHWVHGAIRLSVPLGFLEKQPTLSEEAYDGLIELNRVRYCGTRADAELFRREAEDGIEDDQAEAPATSQPEREIAPSGRATQPLPEPAATRTPPPAEQSAAGAPRELGKGGAKHKYLQQFVCGLAQQHGLRATIEAPIPGGQVDVLLERDGVQVAVEVSVTTPVAWERENLRKCFGAGFARVALVLAKSKTTAKRYREAVIEELSDDERGRFSILDPEDVPAYITSLFPAPTPEENIVRGYRVKASRKEVSPEEAAARRDALARVVAESLRRQRD